MPSLDLDVLGTICAFLMEYPDLLSLSLTCSALRPVAVRNMLRNRPVVLKRVDAISKFHDFVFSDAATRLQHVTALESTAPSLASLALRSSANGRPLGYLDDPRIPAAVGELANLRVLTIIGRTEAADFIGAVRSPLTKLAFCVLRSLTLHNVLGVRQLPVLLKETRMENGAAQERRSWKRLERLICNAETTFTLNLRCQIGLMIIHSCSHISVERRYLVESLREHPPARLNLEVTLAHGIEASLSGMIPPEAAAALTHLTLCIRYHDEHITQDPTAALTMRWDDFWCDTLLPTLERLRCLTHLRFVFHCEAWTRYHEPDCKFLDDLRPASFDLTAVASTIIADAIPSLRGDADFGPASGSGSGRQLVRLHNDVAETIIRTEDLILSEQEEARDGALRVGK
ncbi:hypothetical protein LXA43DRAFT_972764 [Ganoderma leucocontextum]|nr:hypothetical protein LXA43DRAFT_972764 [Ganoderma leucocontextum]